MEYIGWGVGGLVAAAWIWQEWRKQDQYGRRFWTIALVTAAALMGTALATFGMDQGIMVGIALVWTGFFSRATWEAYHQARHGRETWLPMIWFAALAWIGLMGAVEKTDYLNEEGEHAVHRAMGFGTHFWCSHNRTPTPEWEIPE
jgi:hypothetical protein